MTTKANTPAPINTYWDDTLKAWVKVYPMRITRTYAKRTSSTFKGKRKTRG